VGLCSAARTTTACNVLTLERKPPKRQASDGRLLDSSECRLPIIRASSSVQRQRTTESCLHQTPESARVSSCAIGHRLASPLDQSDAAKGIRFPREALYNSFLRKQDANSRALVYASLHVALSPSECPMCPSLFLCPFTSCAFQQQLH